MGAHGPLHGSIHSSFTLHVRSGCTFANLNGNRTFVTSFASSAVLRECHFIENIASDSLLDAWSGSDREFSSALVKLQNCTFTNNTTPAELSAGPWAPDNNVVYYSDIASPVFNTHAEDSAVAGDPPVRTAASPLEAFPATSRALSLTDPFISSLQEVRWPAIKTV